MRPPRVRSDVAPWTIAVVLFVAGHGIANAQPEGEPEAPRRSIGVQGIGAVGVNWLAATKSLEATGLDKRSTEFGGGVQVSDVWRDLFGQVTVAQMSSTGERVFVDPSGTPFPLGIPLSMKARYIDVGVGWKSSAMGSASFPVVPYVSGGIGRVLYRESSPFAEPGEDVDISSGSYHVQAGVEVRIVKFLAVSGDFRYRWVPDLLGKGGASAAFGESEFGGVHAGVGVRFVFGGVEPTPTGAREPAEEIPPPRREMPGALDRESNSNSALLTANAPVFLRMDSTMEPLRTLEAGTSVKVLAEDQDWVRIEFYDRLLGPRVGYVERKHIRIPKLESESLLQTPS
jgi:opacity protein-like surface antigen